MKMPGNNLYLIEYKEAVVSRDIPSLSTSAKKLIIRSIDERLTVAPLSFGKPLKHAFNGYRSLRVGRYRIIYIIDEINRKVIIHSIDHRKDAYL